MPHLHNQPLCMDGRMLNRGGTGVASYARALATAQRTIGCRRLILSDRPAIGPDAGLSGSRASRLLRALLPVPRRARLVRDGGGEADLLVVDDLFRLAHVYFNLHGRLLTVEAPGTGIMHWTYPLPLRLAGWTNVYTVHDAIPLDRPELTPIDPRRHRRILDRIASAADAIVTVSDSARRAIVATLGCPADFVIDCSQPVDVGAGGAAFPAALRRGGYLLVCGSVEPRKNIGRLLDAHAQSGVALPLVIAGPDGWQAGAFAGRDDVIRLPAQDRATIVALIAGARALLMPSLAEGFGLPIVEAMALGTPVLTSAGGATEETAGGAALLVDPEDTAAIAAAMRRLASDDMLCAELRAKGSERARAFTPAAFAARLERLYERLIAGAARTDYPTARTS